MTFDVVGGAVRFIEGLAAAWPTILIGLLIAGVLRYYFGPEATRRLFGGESWRALPQSWAIGMLLPVCSLGVIPILVELRRSRVSAGAMSAFALSAPLFNPMSLLYGLTLARPAVILFFAFGSLLLVTVVGMAWDRLSRRIEETLEQPEDLAAATTTGPARLWGVMRFILVSWCGPMLVWTVVGLSGVALLGATLPHGMLQTSVEGDNPWAPLVMWMVAAPAYATPMAVMSQLGTMFQHANSPGAAFVLLTIGAGLNPATVVFLARNFGVRPVLGWSAVVLCVVLGIAYAVNVPLMPPGVRPAGHTHAFDVYTNPFAAAMTDPVDAARAHLRESLGIGGAVAMATAAVLLLLGGIVRTVEATRRSTQAIPQPGASATLAAAAAEGRWWNHPVSERTVGGVILGGLALISVVMCYAYYPAPKDAMKEIVFARTECLVAANTGDVEHAAYWLDVWDQWTRRLEVGVFLRHGGLRPYQRVQGHLLRDKLEALEHALEEEPYDPTAAQKVVRSLYAANVRYSNAFTAADRSAEGL